METLSGKPLLVLGNKNDLEGALNSEELGKILDLDKIEGRDVCSYSISAKNNKNIDSVIKWMSKHSK